jgi:outer membrane protein OmpA-like peptidoglycan-associated protein
MVNFYFGEGPISKKDREARKQEAEESKRREEEARRQADEQAEAARRAQEESLRNQQAAQSAQAQAQDAQAQAEAARAQIAAAQAEVDQVKEMIASKDIPAVKFESGKATLLAESSETLDRVADVAKKYPNLKLRVEGHTDSQGSDAANMKLSQARADAVKQYLASKGVTESQLTSKGYGETNPVLFDFNKYGWIPAAACPRMFLSGAGMTIRFPTPEEIPSLLTRPHNPSKNHPSPPRGGRAAQCTTGSAHWSARRPARLAAP